MKNIIVKVITLLTLPMAILLTSCDKDKIFENLPSTRSSQKIGTGLVSYQNGMLVFANQAAFDSVLVQLKRANEQHIDSLALEESEDDAPIIPSPILDEFESQFPGFLSLRKKIENEMSTLMLAGTWTEDNNPDDFHVQFTYLRVVLNEKLELKIGNSIFKILTPNKTLEITDGSFAKLVEVDNGDISGDNIIIHNSNPLAGPVGADPCLQIKSVLNYNSISSSGWFSYTFSPLNTPSNCINSNYKWYVADGNGIILESNGYSVIRAWNVHQHGYGPFTVKVVSDCDDCKAERTINVMAPSTANPGPCTDTTPNFSHSVNGAVVSFTNTTITNSSKSYNYLWNYGDGKPTDYTSSKGMVHHTFNGAGTYSVTLTVYNNTDNCEASITKSVIVTEELCCKGDYKAVGRGEFVYYGSNGEHRKFQAVAWRDNKPFFHKVGANTRNYRLKDNHKWVQASAERIYAKVEGTTYTGNCENAVSILDDKLKENKKFVDVYDGAGSEHKTRVNSIETYHYIRYWGILFPAYRHLSADWECQ